ncbi:hypothetical protein ABHZ63_29455, partial [Phocaeicola vulgatus]|uniref:hypothetical protein n=1 Tax=Phocaeicola vulgatus TaxID=821 RepID=UPI0032628154
NNREYKVLLLLLGKKTLLVSIYEIFHFALKFIWSSLYPDLNLKNIPKKQVYFISCLSAFA